MSLYDVIRSAGDGAIVETLAKQAGVSRDQAAGALRTCCPSSARPSGARRRARPERRGTCRDARRALSALSEDPEALRAPGAAADGERVLLEVLADEQREELVRGAAPRSMPTRTGRAGCYR